MLGIGPELGRGFTEQEENGAHALPSSVIPSGNRNLQRTSRFGAAVSASAAALHHHRSDAVIVPFSH